MGGSHTVNVLIMVYDNCNLAQYADCLSVYAAGMLFLRSLVMRD